MLTRREALKIAAAAALLPSLPVKVSAKIDKKPIPTGFAPFDEACGMHPGELLVICSTDKSVTKDDLCSADILFRRMWDSQLQKDFSSAQTLFVPWKKLAYPIEEISLDSPSYWVEAAKKLGHKMLMINTTYYYPEAEATLKKAAIKYQIAVIYTRYTLRCFYSESRQWDHALWVEKYGNDIIVPEFESRRCR